MKIRKECKLSQINYNNQMMIIIKKFMIEEY